LISLAFSELVSSLVVGASKTFRFGCTTLIRNSKMLAEGKPEMVLAFPGGRGTANMVKQARSAGVSVCEVSRTADW
jgi:hypothetical protein